MNPRIRNSLIRIAVALLAVIGVIGVTPAESEALTLAVRVDGNRLVDSLGNPLILRGVNRSGTEYPCVQEWDLIDGPTDGPAIQAMKNWKVNVVRIPLNEHCWLGINGIDPKYSGVTYQNAIKGFVQRLHDKGMYAILELHHAAPGTTTADDLLRMPDADHAPAFWTSVATAFKGDKAVIFDLFNEPYDVSWACWRDGCSVPSHTAAWGSSIPAYQAVGMKRLLAAVRGAGAGNVVMMSGLRFAGDPSKWASFVPADRARQVALSVHSYKDNGCNTWACKSAVKQIAANYPVIFGEIGQHDCAHTYITPLMKWLDSIKASYLGWTWTSGGDWTCAGGPTLIKDYSGTPTNYGIGLKNHFAKF